LALNVYNIRNHQSTIVKALLFPADYLFFVRVHSAKQYFQIREHGFPQYFALVCKMQKTQEGHRKETYSEKRTNGACMEDQFFFQDVPSFPSLS
jgi:hypothetical protein